MMKHIPIKYEHDGVTITITQSPRFYDDDNVLYEDEETGYTIRSFDCPEWRPREKKLFVWGMRNEKDHNSVFVNRSEYETFEKLISNYNRFVAEQYSVIPKELFEI